MRQPIINRIQVTDVHKDRHCELSLKSDELDQIELFKGLCHLNLSPGLSWVHDANLPQHQRFVFRTPHIPVIVSTASVIAAVMELPLDVRIVNDYKSPRPIMVLPFRPFEPERHRFRDFVFTRGMRRNNT